MEQDRPLLLDVSRSIWRASSGRRPTGIDRVCLSYIAHYRSRAQAVVQFRSFRRILSPTASTALFDILLDYGPNFKTRVARATTEHLVELARGSSGKGRLYLNVGHTGLDDHGFRRWLQQSGVKPIYMVHDLIPITHPEYARSGEAERHRERMKTVLSTAAGIIFNSDATRMSLKAWATAHHMALPQTQVISLGTKHLKATQQHPHLDEPYFVILGTIEGRKNHLLLLNLWRDWAEYGQTSIPKLFIVGQRGWAAEQAFSMLDRCPSLPPHVVELSDCDDDTLAGLIGNARALLFPSFVEGYGMPLAEALVAGAPVIASDLPVFREIAGSIPTYCHPLDAKAWLEAILAFIPADGERRSSQCAALAGYQAPTWQDHFEKLDALLDTIGQV